MIATPSGSSPSKISRLGVGDRLDRPEMLDMRRSDRRDQRDMRAHQPGQRGNLAGVVHPHLEHGESLSRGMRARLSGTPVWLL